MRIPTASHPDADSRATPAAFSERSRALVGRLLRPRSPAFAFFCAYAFFVVYGTLLPFQFITDPALVRERWGWINWNPLVLVTGEATPIADIVANITFFLPLGFIGFHAQRRRTPGTAILRSTLAGLALSTTVEVLQYFTPSRNPSTSDVLTNTLGALCGALFATFFRREVEGPAVRRITAWTAREPLLPVLVGVVTILVLGALAPFDFGWSVAGLRHAVKVAQLRLAGTPAQWTSAIVYGTHFAVAAALAVHVLVRVRRGSRLGPVAWTVLGAATLAAGLEVGQLFVRSHIFAVRDLGAGIAGGLAGALCGLALEPSGRSRAGWGIALGVYGAGILATALVPFGFHFDLQSMLSRVTYTALIPYSSYYFKANMAAVADFMEGLLTWLPFAFVLARLRSRGRRTDLRAGLAVIAWCAALALGVELLQFGVPRRYPEISDVLTAALGAALGAYAWSWFAHLAAELERTRPAVVEPARSRFEPREAVAEEPCRLEAAAAPSARASS